MSVEARIAALPLWRGWPQIAPIAAGRTNRNFTVRDRDRRYFVRVGADIPAHGISRPVERRCAALAAEAGIAPRTVLAEADILVTEFAEGETLDMAAGRSPALMSRIAALLRRLHAVPAQPDLPAFCPVEASRRYLGMLTDAELPLPRGRIEACLALLPSSPARCLIHADLIPENFIDTGDRLLLVDWEYAGNGAPETDLAMVTANFGLGDAAAEYLTAAYGAADRTLVERMRIAAIVREALWCLVQAKIGGLAGDLAEYTVLCLERLERALR